MKSATIAQEKKEATDEILFLYTPAKIFLMRFKAGGVCLKISEGCFGMGWKTQIQNCQKNGAKKILALIFYCYWYFDDFVYFCISIPMAQNAYWKTY